MIDIRKESDEVLYPLNDIVALDLEDMDELKRLAQLNSRRRVRLCAHRNPQDKLHEMFIVHAMECYIRPHKHPEKVESINILEGAVDVVLFFEDGSIRRVIEMGDLRSGRRFFLRLDEPVYHTLLIRTPFLVFHEITQGPFQPKSSEFPVWAPAEVNVYRQEFITDLHSKIAQW